MTEEEYFRQWADRFSTLVTVENPGLANKFSVDAVRDDRGCLVPYLDTGAATGTSKQDSAALNGMWLKFLKNNPY